MSSPDGLVVGTAGHIDHGKTSLVGALTGMDTDRLAEEKRRGISIDMGFAHLTLPGGRLISFVDVPGHERFIKNMLAGAGGIQAVLLVVAADESVKPQTREHFEICRLLGIQHGIVVLTKIDISTAEQIATTRTDIKALCAGSFLEFAPINETSAQTGAGLEDLKRELASLTERVRPRDRNGLARLPIDRSFAAKGFGTVVTGTLWNGQLRVGDSVRVLPGEREARIRGLQVHGKTVDRAVAGQRTAVNLTGVEHSEIGRGTVLTHATGVETTTLLDVSVEWLDKSAIPTKRERCLFHSGTAEIPAVLKVLPREPAQAQTFARLWLSTPALLSPGDRFVLRRPSPAQTVAGGTVVDAFPPARLSRPKIALRTTRLAAADASHRIQLLTEEGANGRTLSDLVKRTGMPLADVKVLAARNPKLLLLEAPQRVIGKAWLERARLKVLETLKEFHDKNPGVAGAPIAVARGSLELALAAVVFDHFPAIRIHGDSVALATHRVQVSSEESRSLEQIEYAFRRGGFQPPSAADVLTSAGTDIKKGRGLLESLVKAQRLVRVSEDLIFHADVLVHIRKALSAHKGRKFSVPEFKQWTQISRKYAIPLLEYLDRQHVTRREGDARVVL